MDKIILRVENLTKTFKTNFGPLLAVDDVSFEIRTGENFGLVGESGSGKSTIGSIITGIYSQTTGSIEFQGHPLPILSQRSCSLKQRIQLVFQDPGGSLNPTQTIREILTTPLEVFSGKDVEKKRKEEILLSLLDKVGLPYEYLDKYPRAIGGGEKQLVCIARALAAKPEFIVLDEPTSALDVSIQAKITNKLMDLQKQDQLSYLFITHNLCLVRNMCDRLAIMYLGNICEFSTTGEFFSNPLHPYTQMLLSSIPVITDEEEVYKPRRVKSIGEIPSPLHKPSGCSFHPRCPFKKEICHSVVPVMREIYQGHRVSCHLYPN